MVSEAAGGGKADSSTPLRFGRNDEKRLPSPAEVSLDCCRQLPQFAQDDI